MAHFARIENDIVVDVLVVSDSEEHRGQEFLAEDLGLGGTWAKTSYNSRGGVHYLPDSTIPSGKPHFRYNYAGIGYTFNPHAGSDGAFIPPKPQGDSQWVLDTGTYLWVLESDESA